MGPSLLLLEEGMNRNPNPSQDRPVQLQPVALRREVNPAAHLAVAPEVEDAEGGCARAAAVQGQLAHVAPRVVPQRRGGHAAAQQQRPRHAHLQGESERARERVTTYFTWTRTRIMPECSKLRHGKQNERHATQRQERESERENTSSPASSTPRPARNTWNSGQG